MNGTVIAEGCTLCDKLTGFVRSLGVGGSAGFRPFIERNKGVSLTCRNGRFVENEK